MSKKAKIGIIVALVALALVVSVSVLLVALRKEDSGVAQAQEIIRALDKIAKGQAATDEKVDEYVTTELGLYALGEAAVPAMIDAVVDEQVDSGLRFRLLEMMEIIHFTNRNREPFLKANHKIAKYAANKNGDAKVRARAISYLTSLLDDRYSDKMIEILLDKKDDVNVRIDAANYLNHNTKVDAAPHLKQCVEKFYESSKLRGACATALGGYPTDETVDFLAKVIAEDVTIRGWAINGLGQIETPRATAALIARVKVETDGANIISLAEFLSKRDSPAALDALFQLIQHPDPVFSSYAVEYLATANRVEAIPVIEEALANATEPGYIKILQSALKKLKAL